jgi:hypothetical protein
MNSLEPLLASVVTLQQVLDAEGLPSIAIGGLAIAAWGTPRTTQDADMKVLLGRDAAERLLDLLRPSYTAIQPDPLLSLRTNGFAFFRDRLGTRIDILLAETSFDEAAIRRGRRLELVPGQSIRFCTQEDLIIYKLISTRARDHEDVQGVIRRQGSKLDDAYVIGWLEQFQEALDDSTLVELYQRMRHSRR